MDSDLEKKQRDQLHDGSSTSSHSSDKKVSETAKIKNPLAGMSKEELLEDVDNFAREKELVDELPHLRRGGKYDLTDYQEKRLTVPLALIAQDPMCFEQMEDISEQDKDVLRQEYTHRWRQPWMMYFMTM